MQHKVAEGSEIKNHALKTHIAVPQTSRKRGDGPQPPILKQMARFTKGGFRPY